MDINEYLDEAKKKLDLTSDYALSRAMQIGRSSITGYRNGTRHLDEYACFKLATILEIDPAKLLIDIKAISEKNSTKREFWQSLKNGTSQIAKKGLDKIRIIYIMLNYILYVFLYVLFSLCQILSIKKNSY